MASKKDSISGKTAKPDGMGEAPQAAFEGVPLSDSISSWAEEIAQSAEAKPAKSKAAEPAKPKRTRKTKSDDKDVTARQKAAGGQNPVAGLDISLEKAEELERVTKERKKAQKKKKSSDRSGVTETVTALEKLIEHGRPEFMDAEPWRPHRPDRPEKSEGGVSFDLVTEFEPSGDQPTAIADLVEGVKDGEATQVLLGVTGSGKTFTMAQIIAKTQRPALILAPNKTLAAQLL